MKRHLKRYFQDGNQNDPQFENSLERYPEIKGSVQEVELVMNNRRGCEKYPHQYMDEHCEFVYFGIIFSSEKICGINNVNNASQKHESTLMTEFLTADHLFTTKIF